MVNKAVMSSMRKDWRTPSFIINEIGAVSEDGWVDLATALDCPYPNGAMPSIRYTPDGVFTSTGTLLSSWAFGGTRACLGLYNSQDKFVWCNPPYGSGLTKLWVNRFVDFVGDDYAGGALLIPARTDTKAFRAAWKFTQEHGVGRVVLIGQRLQFDDCGESAPFPSAMFCVGGMGSRLADAVLDEYGGIVVDL